jgi:hypothetical protein
LNMKISRGLILLIIVSACRRDVDISKRDQGKEFYNSKTGSWITYHVDSFVFSDFNPQVQQIDTFRYDLKELIAGQFADNTGRETNRIELYKRKDSSENWSLDRIITSNLTDISLEKTENNIRYVKLIFPVGPSRTWNGNYFNSEEAWEYSYQDLNSPQTINGHVFNETLTVLELDSINNTFIRKGFAKEIYAKNIGMIYRQTDTVEVQNNIKRGLYYRQAITDWSK